VKVGSDPEFGYPPASPSLQDVAGSVAAHPRTSRELVGRRTACHPGARDESGKVAALELKAGNRVLFGKWSGTEVRIDGEDLLIMKESDIMGVIEQTTAKKKAA
jgi:co-chaperonin GroES (HSP10)